jgi:hypothetical protein
MVCFWTMVLWKLCILAHRQPSPLQMFIRSQLKLLTKKVKYKEVLREERVALHVT